MDTLDYSGHGFNQGSKVVIAAAGPKRRGLATRGPARPPLSRRLRRPAEVALPGILIGPRPPKYRPDAEPARNRARLGGFCRSNSPPSDPIGSFPIVVIVDDSEFVARSERNFLWVTFTRSNPAADIDGIGAFTHQKHWGCEGSLVIDARIKPHHAPPLVDDPEIERRVDSLGAPGGPLHGII